MIAFIVEPALDHACAERTRDLESAIRAVRVEYNDVVAPCNRLEASLQVALFVQRQNQYANAHRISRGRTNFAGFPANTDHAGTSRYTEDRAPTTEPSPMLTPGPMKTSAQTQACFPM